MLLDDEGGSNTANGLQVAARIVEARQGQGLSQRDLAERLGVSLGTIDRLEQGLLDPADLLEPLSKALGQPMSFLLNGVGRSEDLAMLEVRLHDVERGMAALAHEREELGRRAASLDERELAQLNDAAKLEALAREFEGRKQAFEGQLATLTVREASVSKREAELNARTAELARDVAAAHEAITATQTELAQERRSLEAMRVALQTQVGLQPHLPKDLELWARWGLHELRELVSRHELAHPDRRGPWATYLRQLEEFADAEGRLPSAYQGLIEEMFSPLLGQSSARLRLAPDESA